LRSYTWKLAIAFILSYVLLVTVVVFSYTQISENFILRQAQDNLLEVSSVASNRINSQLTSDYQKFKDQITFYENQLLDPIEELNNDINEMFILDENYLGFGLLNERIVTIDGINYEYLAHFEFDDFLQNVNIYSFNEAFDDIDTNKYVFFRYENYIGFFDSQKYFDSLVKDIYEQKNYLIISSDNIVNVKDFESTQISFYEILRTDGVSEQAIDQIKDDLQNNLFGVLKSNFMQESSFIIYYPLAQALSLKNFYLVQVYTEDFVIASNNYLTIILLAIFFVIFILFAVSLVLLYKIIEQKMNDIENAKITHYYAKPYIVKINGIGKIKSYNMSFRKLLGDYDIYEHVRDFKIKNDFDMEVIDDVIKRQRAFTALFELGLGKIVYIRFIPVRTSGGYLLIGDDISNIEGSFDEFRNMALFNKVTHLPNYNSLKMDLNDFFSNKIEVMQKNSILALDIVSFSSINILLGDKSGERFIVIVSELLDESLEGYPATLYNIESDKFVVFFRNIESLNWVDRWIKKATTMFEKPITIDKNFINVDLKFGVFNIEPDRYEILSSDVSYDNMMLALNHAKSSSSHNYFIYDVSLSLIASRDQRMELDLANGIKNQEFYMALQPQFDNSSERIIGFEALIRWKNPKYASESPLKFIQMAEKNNMIIDIGRIALHETCSIAKEFEKYNVHISLNISPVQILQAGFVNEIISVFEQYELKKHSICLEITETFLIGSFDLVINKLKLLQKYGFDIHLDDFGTGYSSLQYLKELPINTIKIDREFIIDIENDQHSKAIVQMISNLAKTVGLEVVAEGIENARQNQLVYKSGCNIIQGYYISRPVEKKDALQLILDYNINRTKTVDLQKVKIKETKK
jgi:EAL domain-containing protein (putative c-di-GMP-specific phosphodiesterase class I)/GGDEF domain-containing protein